MVFSSTVEFFRISTDKTYKSMGYKASTLSFTMSESQRSYLIAHSLSRVALAITFDTDTRSMLLSSRLVDPNAPDYMYR